jgi:ABC-2 type transport system permease protein
VVYRVFGAGVIIRHGHLDVPDGQLGLEYHYNALSKGLIDSRNVIYFLSVIALALMATRLVLESRKW